MGANFQAKGTTLTFWPKICQNMNFGLEIQKTNAGIRICILAIPHVPIFRQNEQTTLTFSSQISPKMDVGLEIQKTNGWIKISILEIPCVPIFWQNEQLWLFQPKFAQKWILQLDLQKFESGFVISSKIPCVPIFSQNGLKIWTKWNFLI